MFFTCQQRVIECCYKLRAHYYLQLNVNLTKHVHGLYEGDCKILMEKMEEYANNENILLNSCC